MDSPLPEVPVCNASMALLSRRGTISLQGASAVTTFLAIRQWLFTHQRVAVKTRLAQNSFPGAQESELAFAQNCPLASKSEMLAKEEAARGPLGSGVPGGQDSPNAKASGQGCLGSACSSKCQTVPRPHFPDLLYGPWPGWRRGNKLDCVNPRQG
ncbi:obscurin [Platysternon megacephalum]|uniref:Obscurin n=1 Tax=Platysternon megacephalum TaxID=55544 RepID=A0A4D9E4S3_9SAUR|nr:obscurin [Platysternon megacephalum]